MRIQLLSDIHIEFHDDGGKSFAKHLTNDNADVLVLAGDIGSFLHKYTLETFLKRLMEKFPQIIYVVGNHEYFNLHYEDGELAIKYLEYRCGPQLQIASSERIIEVGSQRFLCGTMWFPDDPMNFVYAGQMADFKYIEGYTPWVYEQSLAFKQFLVKELKEGDVVVTHHLPSHQSVQEAYRTSKLNRFFVYPMDNLIVERRPSYWLHGHGHDVVDYRLEATRVVSNPVGYPGEGNLARQGNCVIEIGEESDT